MANPQVNDEVEDQIRRDYPHLAFYLDHPEIGPILRQATEEGWDQSRLMGAIWQTRWWKTTSDTARAWENTVRSDPATARQRRQAMALQVRQLAGQHGIRLTPGGVAFMREYALRYGWDESHLRNAIANFGLDHLGRIGDGAIRNQATDLLAEAKAYLIPMDRRTATRYALRMMGGTRSAEGWRSMLRRQAGAKFSWMNDLIRDGVTPGDYFAPSRTIVAQTLGVNLEDVNLLEDRWRQLTEYRDPDSGERRAMTDTEAARWARSQAEWRHTDNANDMVAQGASAIMGAMGVAGFS